MRVSECYEEEKINDIVLTTALALFVKVEPEISFRSRTAIPTATAIVLGGQL